MACVRAGFFFPRCSSALFKCTSLFNSLSDCKDTDLNPFYPVTPPHLWESPWFLQCPALYSLFLFFVRFLFRHDIILHACQYSLFRSKSSVVTSCTRKTSLNVCVCVCITQHWPPDGRPPVVRHWPGHFLFGGLVLIKAWARGNGPTAFAFLSSTPPVFTTHFFCPFFFSIRHYLFIPFLFCFQHNFSVFLYSY